MVGALVRETFDMAGIYQQPFIPADPPADGRYVVWTKEAPRTWVEAHIIDGEWLLPRGEGRIDNVHYFMDLNDDDD